MESDLWHKVQRKRERISPEYVTWESGSALSSETLLKVVGMERVQMIEEGR